MMLLLYLITFVQSFIIIMERVIVWTRDMKNCVPSFVIVPCTDELRLLGVLVKSDDLDVLNGHLME